MLREWGHGDVGVDMYVGICVVYVGNTVVCKSACVSH